MKQKKIQWNLQMKIISGLVVMAMLLILILGTILSGWYRKKMEDYYAATAFHHAKIASYYIDGDSIGRYARTLRKDAYYEAVEAYLLEVKETVGLQYFYVVIPDEDTMFYIWDAGREGEEGICALGEQDVYYGDGEKVMKEAFSDSETEHVILVTASEVYGYLASAYVPVLDSRGNPAALAGVDISIELVEQEINQVKLLLTSVITFLLLIAVICYYFFINTSVLIPIHKLRDAAAEIVRGKIEELDEIQMNIRTGDEIEELALTFEYMASELGQYIRNLTAVTAEKERIGAELNVATQIQANILPNIFPAFPDRDEFEIYATMDPAKEVGGDFYDFFLVDPDRLALIIADVSGKGVPAALFMMISRTLLKSAVQSGLSPGEALKKVNEQLCENNQMQMFVTVWLGIYSISRGSLVCANAGHENPAIKQKDGKFKLLQAPHGFVLGGMEGMEYGEYEINLSPGDRLYLYTDGVPEATDKNNRMYGIQGMLDILNRREGISLRELLHSVKKDMDLFADGAPQFDDITMLALWRREF